MHDPAARETGVPIAVPRETVNDDVVIFIRWLVEQGAPVDPSVEVAEIETSKSLVRLAPEATGFLDQVVTADEQVPIGGVLGYVTAQPVPRRAPRTIATPVAPASSGVRISAKAQALMTAHGLDASAFPGLAMIREQDVQAKIASGSATAPAPAPATTNTLTPIRERVPLSPAKRTEVRYLTAGNAQALLSAVTVLIDTQAMDARIAAAAAVKQRLTYLDLLVPAVAATLRRHPRFNATFDGDTLGLYDDVNIGIAINLGTGLFVPVIRQADARTPEEVSVEVTRFAMAALKGGFAEAQLLGGTFTITDLSGRGVYQIQPLINRGQVAILGVGLDDRPPKRLVLTLTFDHRVVDGMEAARLLEDLRRAL